MQDPSDDGSPGADLHRLQRTHLAKTAVKSVFWLLVALTINYHFPEQRWPLYVALVFVGIAVFFNLFVKVMAVLISRRERKNREPDDGA